MSKQIDDGGPAFPFGQISEVTGQPINGCFNPGMSLRDWFAGQALAGQMAIPDERRCPKEREDVEQWRSEMFRADAEICYRYADAMLAASKSPRQ